MLTFKRMWLMLTALCAFATVGCSDDNETPATPQGPATFTLEKQTVMVVAAGGEYSVSYTIENPVANGIVTAVPKHSWIKLDNDSSNGYIKFRVEANESVTERKSEIVVAYSGVEQKHKITVEQAALEGEAFVVENIELAPTAISLDIKPLDKQMAYVCRCMKQEIVDAYILHDDNALFNADMQFIRDEADKNNQSMSHYLNNIVLTGDVTEYTIENLTPNTPYVLYCYYVDLESIGRVGDIHREPLRTAHPPMADVSFEMELTANGVEVIEKITPSDNNIYYYHGYMAVDEFIQWYGTDISYEEAFEKKWNDVVLVHKSWSYDIYKIVTDNCHRGITEQKHSLSANTEYVFFVMAVDIQTGFIASVPLCKTITTGSVAASDLIVGISVKDITTNMAVVTFTPSNFNDTYGCHVVTKDEWLSYGETDQQRYYSIQSRYTLFERNEVFEYYAEDLSASTEYVAYAFGLVNEYPTTQIYTLEFKTL